MWGVWPSWFPAFFDWQELMESMTANAKLDAMSFFMMWWACYLVSAESFPVVGGLNAVQLKTPRDLLVFFDTRHQCSCGAVPE
jgi:hypothetical protein